MNKKWHIRITLIWIPLIIILFMCLNSLRNEKKIFKTQIKFNLCHVWEEVNNVEEKCLIYDSWLDFYDKTELPYADIYTYKILKTAYAAIDYTGEFKKGDLKIYDKYKKVFQEMIQSKIKFVDNTNKEIYFTDYNIIENPNDYDYFFFDVDEDGTPELSIRVDNRCWVFFKYDAKLNKCILWNSIEGTWWECFGSRKFSWNENGGQFIRFYQLGEDGETECYVFFFSVWDYSEEDSIFMVMVPSYADKQKEIIITNEMKKQGIYESSTQRWYFRITKEQYDELTAAYFKVENTVWEKMQEVKYSFNEFLNK